MNDEMSGGCAPTPLPPFAEVRRPSPVRPGYLRSRPWLLLGAVGAAAAADVALWTPDFLYVGPGGYGVALAIVLAGLALAAMRNDLDFRKPEWALLAASVPASVLEGSGLSILVAFSALCVAVGRPSPDGVACSGVVSPAEGVVRWAGELGAALRDTLARVFRGKGGAWAAALAAGVISLGLLAAGNAALAKYIGDVTLALRHGIDIGAAEVARWLFRGGAVIAFGVFAASRPSCAGRRACAVRDGKPSAVALAVLLGVNLAFLASNLIDTYWLGWRRGAPDGVSTTEYLYAGAYALMADAALAGALLLFLFRAGGGARGSRFTRWAGMALAAQCAWLGLGVAGRLALQMDKFGFTPVRLWGVVLLAWGAVGVVGVVRHLRVRAPIGEFASLAARGALVLLAAVQFRTPATLSVDLNLAMFAARPEWRFDDAYYGSVDAEGWRLSHAIARAEPDSRRGDEERAREPHWRAMIRGGSGSDRPGCAELGLRVRSVRVDTLNRRYAAERMGGEGASDSPGVPDGRRFLAEDGKSRGAFER